MQKTNVFLWTNQIPSKPITASHSCFRTLKSVCLLVCLFVCFLVLIDCKWYIPFDLLLWLLRIWFCGANQKIILTSGVEKEVSDTFHSLPNEPISAREKYYSLEWCILMPHSIHLNSGVDLGTRWRLRRALVGHPYFEYPSLFTSERLT